MTNEQLTQEVLKLAEHQAAYEARCEAEKEKMLIWINEIKEDVKTTKTLTEAVHIMAVDIKNMQEEIGNTRKNVEDLIKKDYNNYEESKKIVKKTVLSKITDAIITAIIVGISTLSVIYINKGGI